MITKSNRNRERKVEKKVRNYFWPILTFFPSMFDGCFRSIHPISTTTSTTALIFWIMLLITIHVFSGYPESKNSDPHVLDGIEIRGFLMERLLNRHIEEESMRRKANNP